MSPHQCFEVLEQLTARGGVKVLPVGAGVCMYAHDHGDPRNPRLFEGATLAECCELAARRLGIATGARV